MLSYLIILIWLLCVPDLARSHSDHPHTPDRLLIVSFDGFRWDYLKRLPAVNNFTRIFAHGQANRNGQGTSKGGVWAPGGIKNSFVTKTFPNHYAMATGLYEESSGIVANSFWDPEYHQVVHLTDPEKYGNYSHLFLGEPIWLTHRRQRPHKDGVGCYMWVGCDYDIGGVRLSHTVPYRSTPPWRARADTVLRWFVNDGIELGLLYYNQPDHTAHQYGPESAEVTAMIAAVNDDLGYLLDQMEFYELSDSVNLVVTSDHGFTRILGEIAIPVDAGKFSVLVAKDDFWHVEPAKGVSDEAVVDYFDKFDHVTAYKKADLPVDYHYAASDRLTPVVVLAEFGYVIANPVLESVIDEIGKTGKPAIGSGKKSGSMDRSHGHARSASVGYVLKGTHGYNNSRQEMWPIFMARGPAIRFNDTPGGYITVPAGFKNIDIYNLICMVLHLRPAPNNGSVAHATALVEPQWHFRASILGQMSTFEEVTGISGSLFIVAICCACAIGFVVLAGFAYTARRRRHIRYSSSTSTGSVVGRRSNGGNGVISAGRRLSKRRPNEFERYRLLQTDPTIILSDSELTSDEDDELGFSGPPVVRTMNGGANTGALASTPSDIT